MLESGLDKIDTEVQTSLSSLGNSSRSEVEKELCKLREDKSLLEGKIRGYLTLSDICQEYKEELKKLKAEYKKLLAKVKDQEMKSDHPFTVSPTPDDQLGTADGHEEEQRTNNNDNDINIESTEKHIANQSKTQAEEINDIYQKDKQIRTSDLFDPGPENHGSIEGLKSVPEMTSNKSDDVTKEKVALNSTLDKYPMQESLALSSHSHLNQASLIGFGFEHVGSDLMPMGESAVSTQKKDKDLIYFASLLQHSEKDKTDKNTQEQTEINEVITSLPLDGDETRKVLRTVSNLVEKREQRIKKLEEINKVLLEKFSRLQQKTQDMDKDRERILQKLQRLEKENYNLSRSSSRSPQEGWVKVDKITENEVQKSSVEKLSGPRNSVEGLQEQNKQLRDANQRWSREWDSLRNHFETRITELQVERDQLAKEITDRKICLDAKERDYEKMIMNAKKKAEEEESAKEEALVQLNAANNRLDGLNEQVTQQQDELLRLRREKQSIQTELNVVRQQGPGSAGTRAEETPIGSTPERTITDLKNEICVLRHQLLVFQEDFDKERQDRATAQSIKDDLKKQNDTLKRRSREVEMKSANLERQLKTSEDNTRSLLQEKDKLVQELCDVKNQLQRERENNAMAQYRQTVIPSQGFYQPLPPPQRMYGHMGIPEQPQPYQVVTPHSPPYPYRVNEYNRNVGTFVPASHPHPQPRNVIYQQSPQPRETEMLAGAWSCSQCTYKNYPGRTVCEMCGYITSPSANQTEFSPASGPLTPRGDNHIQQQQRGHVTYSVAHTRKPDSRR